MFDSAIFDFTDAEIREAAAANRLLSIEIEFNRLCNYRCPYCYAGDPETELPEMSSELADSVIRQAAELGARKVVILGGEPLLYPELERKIELVNFLGMGAEIFTNGALLDEAAARMFAAHNCRVVVKLNSLDPAVQARMTGEPEALELAQRALRLLREAGCGAGRVAASSVICSENVDGMPALWRYLREREILPYFEMMTPQGRMLENRHLMVEPARLRQVFEEIAAIDAQFGFCWEPQPPLVGGKCFRHIYSCLVNASGDVMPCVGVTTKLGSAAERPVRDILFDSSVIRDLKNYRKMIKGPCRTCRKAQECYGCRGAAYQMTGDYLASDPLCWHNIGRESEIAVLPCDARSLVPHKPPMVMVDEVLSSGQTSEVLAVIRPDNRFLDDGGVLDRAALPELVSQAGAAADAFRNDGAVKPGMLVGCRKIEYFRDIRVGDRLVVSLEETAALDGWHIVAFNVVKEGEPGTVASGELKLCVLES